MKIEVENISKRFGRQQIIKQFSYTFAEQQRYVITGANGSGKSTLLKIISGYLSHDSGNINYWASEQPIANDAIADKIAYSAPYIAVPEDLTVREVIQFQKRFKPLSKSEEELEMLLHLPAQKKIAALSSGMRQRLHLGLSVFSSSSLLLLDEPTSFFDKVWKANFQQFIAEIGNKKTIILCSNDEEEYSQFDKKITLP